MVECLLSLIPLNEGYDVASLIGIELKVLKMSTVQEITSAIAKLPREQVEQIRAWLEARTEAEWDAQIEQDACSGKLDHLIHEALAEHKAGLTKPL